MSETTTPYASRLAAAAVALVLAIVAASFDEVHGHLQSESPVSARRSPESRPGATSPASRHPVSDDNDRQDQTANQLFMPRVSRPRTGRLVVGAQLGGTPRGVGHFGSYLVLGQGPRLAVMDVTDPESERVVGRSTVLDSRIADLAVVGSTAFVLTNRLHAIDLSTPTDPREIGQLHVPARPNHLLVADGLAYVTRLFGLGIIDVRDPGAMQEVGFYHATGFNDDIVPRPLASTGTTLYVVGQGLTNRYRDSVHIVDVSVPSQPERVGEINLHQAHLAIVGEHMIALYRDDNYDAHLAVYDIAGPRTPEPVARIPVSGAPAGLVATPTHAYGIVSVSRDGAPAWDVMAVDIGDRDEPIVVSRVEAGRSSPKWGFRVALNDHVLAVTDDADATLVQTADPPDRDSVTRLHTTALTLATDIVASGTGWFAADGRRREVLTIEVGPRSKPRVIGRAPTSARSVQLAAPGTYGVVHGQYDEPVCPDDEPCCLAYLAVHDAWLREDPAELGRVDLEDYSMYGFAVSNDVAYTMGTANDERGSIDVIEVIDIADPTRPSVVSRLRFPSRDFRQRGIVASAGVLYVAYADGQSSDEVHLRMVDVSNPTAPMWRGVVDTWPSPWSGLEMIVEGDRLYAAFGDPQDALATRFHVYDISVPGAPRRIHRFGVPGRALAVAASGTDLVFLTRDQASVVDASHPRFPYIVAADELPLPCQFSYPYGVAFSDGEVAVSCGEPGIVTMRLETR